MAFRISQMTALRGTDYKRFEAKLKKSFTKHKGVLLHVALDLDVGDTTVKRWLREDAKLRTFVDRLRRQQAA